MRIVKLRGKPLSLGPPRPFWGCKPQKGLGGPRLSGFPLNLIFLP